MRVSMTNLDSILKSRDFVTLPTKVRLVKAMVFPVVMYGYESWTVKKAEHQRIDAFELWCWRRLLRVPWPIRRSNQTKEVSPEYSLEGLMLKHSYFDSGPEPVSIQQPGAFRSFPPRIPWPHMGPFLGLQSNRGQWPETTWPL